MRDVYVGGRQVVFDREVLMIDQRAAAERLTAMQRRVVERLPKRDRRGRRAAEVAPLTYDVAAAPRRKGDVT